MTKLLYRAATGITTAALIASSFSSAAFAGLDVQVSGNGANSTNTTNTAINNTTQVTQNNDANIQNNVNVNSNTGGNDANANTGGDVSVTTGDADTTVGVSNVANQNVANVDGCCPNDVSVEISGNGAKSDNDANVAIGTQTWVTQDNNAKVKNNVNVGSNTGYNDANRNTGGDVSIDTGKASSTVAVANALNKNVATIGGANSQGSGLAVVIKDNGARSKNTANVAIATLKGVTQNNYANVKNDVDVYGNTGKNDANANTGGDVSIDTGNALANVDVSNLANFNSADIDGCGCIIDGLVKIANNGAKSDNDANVLLASTTAVTQDNIFSCGHSWFPKRGNLLSKFGGHHGGSCNDVNVDLNTGKNDANRNGGEGDSDPVVMTGDADANVLVETTANSNEVGNADFDFDFPSIPGTGSSASLILMLLAFFS